MSRSQLLAKQSYYAKIISIITGKNLLIMADGSKIGQTRFTNYDANYNSFDPSKKYHTRSYMGCMTTSAYFVDFYGAFQSNGSHGDSHVLNYIVQHNVNGINTRLNRSTDICLFDRGFRFLWGHFPYWMIMPSLNRAKPVPTLYINVSRLATHVRWMNEQGYGILKGQWGITSVKIHQKWKVKYQIFRQDLTYRE